MFEINNKKHENDAISVVRVSLLTLTILNTLF